MARKYTEQHHWNAVFSIAFLVFAVLLFFYLDEEYGFGELVYAVTAFDLAVMGLAAFRLVRLLSYDKIFGFVRLWFMDAHHHPDGGVTYGKPERGPRRTIAELLECPWCTGIWASLVVVAFYFILPITRFLVVILAAAAIGSFLLNISKAIARSAGGHDDAHPGTC